MSKHILLLPGHGNSDSGALTQDKKYKESDSTYVVAFITKQLLEFNGFKCTLSRTSNQMCGNATNVKDDVNNQIKMGNSGLYDLAIAIHFNAFNNKAKGVEVIYNNMFYKRPEAIKLGSLLLEELLKTTRLTNRGLKNIDGVGVIKRVKIPIVLSECCFIDNPNEQIWAIDKSHQFKLAEAHAKAVCKYYGVTYKEKLKEEEENLIPVKVVMDGQILEAYLINGKTFVEIRKPLEMVGKTVNWDAKTNITTIK